jgi:mRNA-decapping enzyme 1B
MEEARKQANLRTLQRAVAASLEKDMVIADILATATHVVLYEFELSSSNWTKANVEGSLFLAETSNQLHKLIILNRNTPENFILSVDASLQIQQESPPYVILKESSSSRILGIWFHNDEERIRIDRILRETVQEKVSSGAVDTAAAAMAALGLTEAIAKQQQQQQQQQQIRAKSASHAISSSATTTIKNSTPTGPATASSSVPVLSTNATPYMTTRSSTALTAPATAASSLVPPGAPPDAVALDKKSLQLALLSLIQDERFLDLLHTQYLKVVRSRAKKQQQQQQQHPAPQPSPHHYHKHSD